MTQLADFVIVNTEAAAANDGKWKSEPFESGGRLIRRVGNAEKDNAYFTLTLTSPQGGQDVAVRLIVNDRPLPVLIEIKANSQRTAVMAFPASLLHDADNNVVELHSRGEVGFAVLDVICHFRQNS